MRRIAFFWCGNIVCRRGNIYGSCRRGRWIQGKSRCRRRVASWWKRRDIARKKWTKLAEFYPSPGFLSEKMTIYLATGLTAGEAKPMDDERIETRWFTATEMDEMIRTGKIQDAKTNVGFLRWKRYFAGK